jgi:UbiA prenyltransferase family protein
VTRPSRARTYLVLGRVSNLPTVWTNVLAGAVLAGGRPRAGVLVALAMAASLSYLGGMFLNDAFDRDADARARPERPIPAGLIGAGEVFAVGFGLLAAGWLGVVAVAGLASRAALAGLALAVAIVVYDAWHKGNPLSPFLMGLCRALVYVTAGVALAPAPAGALWGGVVALLAYLIGLTYVAKHEGGSALARLWPLAFLAVPFVYALPALGAGAAGIVLYVAFAAAVVSALRILWSDEPRRIPRTVVTLIAGISLLDAVLVAGAGASGLGLAAGLGFVLTLALQRYVSGT